MELLRQLVEMSGIPGREDRVRKLVIDQLKPLVDDIRVDQMGNVIAFKKGKRIPVNEARNELLKEIR